MCLAIQKNIPVLKAKDGNCYGYKVFRQSRTGTLYGEYFAHHKIRKVGEWLRSSKGVTYTAGSRHFGDVGYYQEPNPYPQGFHVFLKQVDAIRWVQADRFFEDNTVIRKVQIREIRTTGLQRLPSDTIPVAVVGEMFILPE